MSKDAELRLSETLACVPVFAGNDDKAADIHAVLTEWVGKQENKEALSQQVSLGGWHPFASAADKAHRGAQRAVLLAHKRAGGSIAKQKAAVQRMSLANLRTEMLRLFDAEVAAPNTGVASFAPSFDHASEAERDIVRKATAEVRARLSKAVDALSKARVVPAEKARFVTWFGPYSDAKLNTVLKNFNTMASNRKGYHYYYRGSDLPNRYEEVVLPGGVPMPQVKSSDVAFYAKDSRRDADPLRIHLFIGSGGLLSGTVPQRGSVVPGSSKASRASVIIHELSHFLCQTRDEMYGSVKCREAAARNDPRVLVNASNFQWYAEEFS